MPAAPVRTPHLPSRPRSSIECPQISGVGVVTRDLAFPIGGCAPLLSKRPGDSLASARSDTRDASAAIGGAPEGRAGGLARIVKVGRRQPMPGDYSLRGLMQIHRVRRPAQPLQENGL